MTVSVCMMVRNEEPVLRRALVSTLGLADEVVIVDTGSTDNTVAIAQEWGAKVITGGDRRHKAQERNRSIEHASGDWVVILDADEVISEPQSFRRFLEQCPSPAVYIRETYMHGDTETLSFSQMRAWKRGTYEYRFRAHEVPLPVGGAWTDCAFTSYRWEHRPYGDRRWKREHMLMLLCMDVEENPGEPRPLYYLSREYLYLGAWQACIETTEEYLRVSEGRDREQAEAYGNLATCYEMQRQPEKTIEYLRKAMQLEPQNRAWQCCLAERLHMQQRHDEAIAMLKLAIELPRMTAGYTDERFYGAMPYDLLARCYYYSGRKAEGLPWAKRALEVEPDNERLKQNLAFFEQESEPAHADT